jgi:hypothetical protein
MIFLTPRLASPKSVMSTSQLNPYFLPPVSQEDLDHAKSLVLDLLGWGVTPEYLVECGVSTSAILRIFGDLKLRLPYNLEDRTLKESSR